MRTLRLLPLLVSLSCDPGGGLPAEGCTQDLDCPDGHLCQSRVCVEPASLCPEAFTACGGVCVEVSRDAVHCGGCDAPCAEGVACVAGACCAAEAPLSCGGRCTDPGTDRLHCGGCGVVCVDGQHCSDGLCCAADQIACGGLCRAIATDVGACGGCDVRCPVGTACVDATCTACPGGTERVDCGAAQACLPPDAPRDPCMAFVPAATFVAGAGEEWDDSTPRHEVTITAGFWLDLVEVTQAQYAPCADAGVCASNGVLDPVLTPHLPAVWLGQEDAATFCAFRGDRLPTEAEWELAARGTDDRIYPWGMEAIDCGRANYNKCGSNVRETGREPAGAGPFGHLDLAGNVSEWVSDLYGPYTAAPLFDPTGPLDGAKGVRRGGHFDTGDLTTSSYAREGTLREYFDSTTGVRCVREAP